MYPTGHFESRHRLTRKELSTEPELSVENRGLDAISQTQERRPLGRPLPNSSLGILENLYVLSLPALGPFDYAERDSLAFLQAAETVGLNRRIVNEYIFSILTADEAVALRVIEPLNCSLFHDDASSFDVDIAQLDRDVMRQGLLLGRKLLRTTSINRATHHNSQPCKSKAVPAWSSPVWSSWKVIKTSIVNMLTCWK